MKDSQGIRKVVRSCVFVFETRWLSLNKQLFPAQALCPPLPELKMCLLALEEVFLQGSVGPMAEGCGAVLSFIDPISVIFSGQELQSYMQVNPTPMDWGTVIHNLVGALYPSLDALLRDVAAIAANCERWWDGSVPERTGDTYTRDARTLEATFRRALESQRDAGLMASHVPVWQAGPGQERHAPPHERDRARGGKGGQGGAEGKARQSHAPAAPQPRLLVKAPNANPNPNRLLAKPPNPNPNPNPNRLLAKPPRAPGPAAPQALCIYHHAHGKPPLSESDAQLQRRAGKYASKMFQHCLDEAQKHVILGPGSPPLRVVTAGPFIYKVDGRRLPEYHPWLQREGREEMYLQLIGRKVRAGDTDGYGTSVAAILRDMQTLRDNAHAFNKDDESVEVRIMADALLHYFRYLLRVSLQSLSVMADPLWYMLASPDTSELLGEPDAPDVTTFLALQARERQEKEAEKEAKRVSQQQQQQQQQHGFASFAHAPAHSYADLDALDLGLGLDDDDTDYWGGHEGSGGRKQQHKRKSKGGGQLAGSAGGDFFLDPSQDPYQDGYAMDVGPPPLPIAARTLEDWEIASKKVLDKISKHPFVRDPLGAASSQARSRVIADFFHPVCEMFPHMAVEYATYVKEPMDLGLLAEQLYQGALLDADEFYEKLLRVFTNLATFNERTDSPYAKEMVGKGSHLAKYARWLCLEMLPLKSEEGKEADQLEMLGDLRETVRTRERQAREALVAPALMANDGRAQSNDDKARNECKNKLLKPLHPKKGQEELKQYGWFAVKPYMPSDYAVYVRRPMDLGSIQARLDLARHQGGYCTYGEVLGDARLVFANALRYNSVHMANDEGSHSVHAAALRYRSRLEDIVPNFTLDLAERIERDRMAATHEERIAREELERNMQARAELDAYQEELKAHIIQEDTNFAADLDVQARTERTAMEKAEEEKEEQARRLAAQELGQDEDADADALFADYDGFDGLGLDKLTVPSLRGYGLQDAARLRPSWPAKRLCREAAWQAWEPVGYRGGPGASSPVHQPRARAELGLGLGSGLERDPAESVDEEKGRGGSMCEPRSRAGSSSVVGGTAGLGARAVYGDIAPPVYSTSSSLALPAHSGHGSSLFTVDGSSSSGLALEGQGQTRGAWRHGPASISSPVLLSPGAAPVFDFKMTLE